MTPVLTASRTRRRVLTALAAAGALAFGGAHAQGSANSKPLRLIVPLTTGSLVDSMARSISNELSRVTGRSVVVENLPGAGGITGTLQLVRAPKDDSTLALVSSNHVINPSIYASVPFDSLKDVTPITVLGASTMILAVNPSVQAKTTQELIALAKASPGKLNFASSGNGTTLHLAAELFNVQAGVKTTHVPYKGQGPAITDLIGGQVDAAFIAVATGAPHVKSGKLRALGVSSTTRSPVLPEVAPLAETGLPQYSLDSWVAVIAPPNTSRAKVLEWQEVFRKVLASKEVQDAFAAQGIAPKGTTAEWTAEFFKSEHEKYARVIQQTGIKGE
jgi:tripartite-type tricarboxylate transporter receptor subunit TctC